MGGVFDRRGPPSEAGCTRRAGAKRRTRTCALQHAAAGLEGSAARTAEGNCFQKKSARFVATACEPAAAIALFLAPGIDARRAKTGFERSEKLGLARESPARGTRGRQAVTSGDSFALLGRAHQFDVTDTQGASQLIEGHDRGIAAAAFQCAEILLAETGFFGELFLGQPGPSPDAFDVFPDQDAHVHARQINPLHSPSLSTLVCILTP